MSHERRPCLEQAHPAKAEEAAGWFHAMLAAHQVFIAMAAPGPGARPSRSEREPRTSRTTCSRTITRTSPRSTSPALDRVKVRLETALPALTA